MTYVSRSLKSTDILKLLRGNQISPKNEETNYQQLLPLVARHPEPSTVVVFSDLLRPSNQKNVLASAPFLPKKHQIIFTHLMESQYHLATKLKQTQEFFDEEILGSFLYACHLEVEKKAFLAKLQKHHIQLMSFDEMNWLPALGQIYPMLRFVR